MFESVVHSQHWLHFVAELNLSCILTSFAWVLNYSLFLAHRLGINGVKARNVFCSRALEEKTPTGQVAHDTHFASVVAPSAAAIKYIT
jgi:hypothetical protein